MKYNKSEIMSKAWKRYKLHLSVSKGYDREAFTFDFWLHCAWEDAKNEVALQEVEKNGVEFKNGMTVPFFCRDISLSRWTKYGKDRCYINGSDGWYDIQKDEFHWKSSTNDAMRYIRAIRF